MKVMLLAAGFGKRMQTLTANYPKSLLKVGKYSLIERLLLQLKAAGASEIVINLHHAGLIIQRELRDGARYGLQIEYSIEPTILETGGGIKRALPLLGTEPFLVVSADVFTDYPFAQLLHHQPTKLAHWVLVTNPPHHPNGDFGLTNQGLLIPTAPRLTFSGIAVYQPQLFQHDPREVFPVADVVSQQIAKAGVSGEYYAGTWLSVDTPERLAAAALAADQ